MLNHIGTIKIETGRLLLRSFAFDDTSGMFNNWASDIDVCKYMRWSPHTDKEEIKKILSRWIDSYNKEFFYK